MSDPGRRPGACRHPGPDAGGLPSDGDAERRGPVDADPSVELIRFWYRRHADRVYRYARWRTGSREAAETVVSDVFLEAWRSSDDYAPERGSVESWLLGIARNVMRRKRRRRERAPEPVDPTALEDLAAPAPTPEDEMVRDERRARILEAVWELPPTDRDLVALAYGAELTSGRIARLLETTPGAVRTRLHRVLRRLRRKLEGA